MHDPMTVAFEIPNIFVRKTKLGYRPSIITIWHIDPETDGSDDSCGWFKRAHHGDQNIREAIRKDFAFNFKNDYWFNAGGYPIYSVVSTVLNMYNTAAWVYFDRDRKKVDRFMKKNLLNILHFAENPTDSLHSSITMKYGVEKMEYRCNHFADIIFADIMRKEEKWYQHARWHIHHWRIQFRPWQQFKRRFIEKCCKCGVRGFTGNTYGDWDGTKIWCEKCNGQALAPRTLQQ